MEKIVLIIHVIVALSVIGLVLLQHGKGADMGAAFGSGSSGSLFGVRGSANVLSRATAMMVVVFFITSLSLTYFSGRSGGQDASVVNRLKAVPASSKSAIPADNKPSSKDIPQ